MMATNIRHAAVIGAGTMGHGIGSDLARAGLEVVLCDLSAERLQLARSRIERGLEEFVGWGLLADGEVSQVLARIRTTTSLLDAVADADLVIEAVYENLELKREVFRQLDALCAEHTILASNTSSYRPGLLAQVTGRPDRVVVAHFFYPPPLMPLVEIVRGPHTSMETVEAVRRTLEAAGKSPIVLHKEAAGFLANRLQMALLREALFIVEQGIASAQDVDTAVHQGFGRRLAVVGPIELAEVQDGWHVIREIERQILPDLDASRQPPLLLDEKITHGELGPASGRGFYEWTAGKVQNWEAKLGSALAGFLQADRSQRGES
jgi:3-hydroxybutyryl-CoA dehydrogenase